MATMILLQYQDISFWGRTHRDVRLYVNPPYPLYSTGRFIRESLPSGPKIPLQSIAVDAVRAASSSTRPLLVVLVVGETARAENFQLNGYARATNPQLSRIPGLLNFSDTHSCGTATAESVPCMFSLMDRTDFSRAQAAQQENLLDVALRVGVSVHWRDNDSGCQGVCARTANTEFLENDKDPELCPDGECYDGILLKNIERYFPQTMGTASMLVLHQKGSHGPAYFKRYPDSARRYLPDCRDENVQRCTRDEVVNAYDNTIAYTDQVLTQLIGVLQQHEDRMDTVMIYVSDHGESLGENGLYLHGMPYRLAPSAQTHIPMMAWFSSQALHNLKLNPTCVQNTRDGKHSHDNLFSTLLGLLSIQTRDYATDKDLFHDCRTIS